MLFTDDYTEYDYPPNVVVRYMDFHGMRNYIQSKFDFPLALDTPYKLCDFKPAYGEIFSDYLNGYDYWGHCDIDLFWGDIRAFITEDVLAVNKRVFSRGHCSLYENSAEVIRWYRTLSENGFQKWEKVFQTSKTCCFDEWAGHCGGGISHIIKSNGIKQYDEVCMADINVMTGRYKINRMNISSKTTYFEFDKGTLKLITGKSDQTILYVHFQKRKLKIDKMLNPELFYLVAPDYLTSDRNKVKRNIIKEKVFEMGKILEKLLKKLRIKQVSAC